MPSDSHSAATTSLSLVSEAYHGGECRHSRPATCHSAGSSTPVLQNLMKSRRAGCQTGSRSRSKSPSVTTATLFLLALLALDLSLVSCMPILATQTEFPSSDASVSKQYHHHHRHHHRHHLHRERHKNHHKHLQFESVEILDTSGSLSIVTPLDVLRQNMILEIQRKRLREAKDKQVKINSEFLERIG